VNLRFFIALRDRVAMAIVRLSVWCHCLAARLHLAAVDKRDRRIEDHLIALLCANCEPGARCSPFSSPSSDLEPPFIAGDNVSRPRSMGHPLSAWAKVREPGSGVRSGRSDSRRMRIASALDLAMLVVAGRQLRQALG
jgi:hypothetical protein